MTGVGNQTAGAPVRTGYDMALQPDKGRKQQIWCGMPDAFIECNSLLCNLTVWSGLSVTWCSAEDGELQSMPKQTHTFTRSLSRSLLLSSYVSWWDALRLIHKSHSALVLRLSHIHLLFWHLEWHSVILTPHRSHGVFQPISLTENVMPESKWIVVMRKYFHHTSHDRGCTHGFIHWLKCVV